MRSNDHRMTIVVHVRPLVTGKRPYGARHARAFINDVASAAPDVPIQTAHLAGAGGYDDPLVDEALGVSAEAAARRDPRLSRFYSTSRESPVWAQTIRIQQREDGVSIDQIVLSPSRYRTTSPGALKNDRTILQ
jgi:hypothetical protein